MGQIAEGVQVEGDPEQEAPAPSVAEQMANDIRSFTDDPDSGSAGTEVEQEGEASSSTSTPPPAEPPAPEFIDIGGFQVPVDQTDAVVSLLEWASSLTEEQAAAAFAAASGQPVVEQQPPTPAAPPAAPPESAIPAELRESYPEVASVMERMEQELADLRAGIEPRIEQVEQVAGREAYARTQQEIVETEARVRESFLASKGLADADYDTLASTAAQLGIVPALVESLGAEAGFKQALEIAYNANDEFAQRRVDAAVKQQATQQKKDRAAGLTPQGGSAPRTTPSPANLPESEKRAAMRAEIEQMISGG